MRIYLKCQNDAGFQPWKVQTMTDMIYSDVFDALADTPIEAENLKTWADLMASIQAIIQAIIQTKVAGNKRKPLINAA